MISIHPGSRPTTRSGAHTLFVFLFLSSLVLQNHVKHPNTANSATGSISTDRPQYGTSILAGGVWRPYDLEVPLPTIHLHSLLFPTCPAPSSPHSHKPSSRWLQSLAAECNNARRASCFLSPGWRWHKLDIYNRSVHTHLCLTGQMSLYRLLGTSGITCICTGSKAILQLGCCSETG